MPSASTILSQLSAAANGAYQVAVVWHTLLALALIAILAGWRPRRSVAASVLSLPLASVALISALYDSDFNAVAFTGLFVALLVLPLNRPGDERLSFATGWRAIAGALLMVFGWFYPHFFVGHGALAWTVAAPLGVVPCATLSFVVGATLLADGFGDRAWAWTVVGAGLFYGAFGVITLGVWIDIVLLVGAIALTVETASAIGHAPPHSLAPRH